jgi:protein SCO1/2
MGALMLMACAEKPALPALGMVPDFTLTDQQGAAFSSAAHLAKKIWVADFIFTNCPGPCPRMSSQMHQVQSALSADDRVRFISFTVDPARDTPAVLSDYGKHFEAIPGKWTFLTGAPADLQKLGKDAFKLNDVDGGLEHSTRFALVDGEGRIRGYYSSLELGAIDNLIADARRLLKEAA